MSTIQLRNHVTLRVNGRTIEYLLRILREIDIPATLRYEAYFRRRENGSSPFVPRKSWRDLTSHRENEESIACTHSIVEGRYRTHIRSVACIDAQRKKE